MADWKRLTSPSGDRVYLNLDVMIGMQHNPDINITFLQSVSDPRVNIEVRETPNEILSASSTYGSSSNVSPGIWLVVILGGLLVVFALTAMIVSILIHG
jgi:hypothetical protein